SSGAGRTSDGNGSHASTLKSPSYTKSVSWQHYRMTDGWPLYESRLKGKLHVISKRYTQRIERHNLNLRQHLARLGRKSLSFSKSVELHDKVIGHYLNIKHYQ
ncbi:IS1 family transposase, partial [Escherichia coli]